MYVGGKSCVGLPFIYNGSSYRAVSCMISLKTYQSCMFHRNGTFLGIPWCTCSNLPCREGPIAHPLRQVRNKDFNQSLRTLRAGRHASDISVLPQYGQLLGGIGPETGSCPHHHSCREPPLLQQFLLLSRCSKNGAGRGKKDPYRLGSGAKL